MAKDQRMEKVVADLRKRIAELEAKVAYWKNWVRKIKAAQPSKARPGGCG